MPSIEKILREAVIGKWMIVMVVMLCAFTGVAVSETASEPVAVANNQAPVVSNSVAANDTVEPESDCDLVDIDGHNNTVLVNITHNTTAGNGRMAIQYRCGTDTKVLDHDLIDVDGNNNTVTVTMRVENTTIGFAQGGATDNNGLRVALGCGANVSKDCDGVDINGHNNSVALIVENDTERTVHEFGSNSSNVSWTGSENSGSAVNDGNNSTSTTIRSDDRQDRSDNGEERSDDVLDSVANALPVMGAITLFVLGSALLVKRSN